MWTLRKAEGRTCDFNQMVLLVSILLTTLSRAYARRHSSRPLTGTDGEGRNAPFPTTGQRTVAETARPSESRYGNRPTMKDVAARAGVGLKTVSRVVNSEPGVTPDTERRVEEAIEALGFRRNDSARVLRKGRTASIGTVWRISRTPSTAR